MDTSLDAELRESAFAWLRARSLHTPAFTRDDLAQFTFRGSTQRLVGTQTGIWRVKEVSDAAISILTAYVPDGLARPYDDTVGADGMLRYKFRGTDPTTADNVWLRRAMNLGVPLIWFFGIGHVPGTKTQIFTPRFPVWIVGEEPAQHQFVVSVEEGWQHIPADAPSNVVELAKRYNERIVKSRHHQPLFREMVLHAYDRRCSICRLPFAELLDAAHIQPDSEGGAATLPNGMALCKIHHGAYDRNIIGVSPDYVVHVRPSVLETFDGPTLQHSIKELDGQSLRQLPRTRRDRPDPDLLSDRFTRFLEAS